VSSHIGTARHESLAAKSTRSPSEEGLARLSGLLRPATTAWKKLVENAVPPCPLPDTDFAFSLREEKLVKLVQQYLSHHDFHLGQFAMRSSNRKDTDRFTVPSPREVGLDGALTLMGITAIVVIAGLGLDLRPILQAVVDAGRDLIHQVGMLLSQV
jgi:hypothetical protein